MLKIACEGQRIDTAGIDNFPSSIGIVRWGGRRGGGREERNDTYTKQNHSMNI